MAKARLVLRALCLLGEFFFRVSFDAGDSARSPRRQRFPHFSFFRKQAILEEVNQVADFLSKLNPQQREALDRPPTLDELIAKITPENLHRSAWSEDAPVGNEAW